jgi:nucleotide-binding universal stress UspA family protein
MKEITSIPSNSCVGKCQGCGKAHIKVYGYRDLQSQQLHDRIKEALVIFPMAHKLIEVYEPGAIAADGVSTLPALVLDGTLVSEGQVPAVDELVQMFRTRYLFKSKLHRLKHIIVPVDMSTVSANALLFAWQIAKKTEAHLEVIFAMDSIFEGSKPSASGFLSGYNKTMQSELDAFIQQTMASDLVSYTPPVAQPGNPGETVALKGPHISSKVIYGFPDTAIQMHSQHCDLIVMGTTGGGTITHKLFGSVSMEVSKNAQAPVLFIPPDVTYEGFPNMLYASNFESLDALRIQQAVSFAHRFESQIHFVHIGPAGEKGFEMERKLFEANYQELHPDKPFIFTKMVSDDIVDPLYEYAFYHRIGLLVFVTHQRSFWENFLHKSITREVLSSSALPVLVIHSDSDMI